MKKKIFYIFIFFLFLIPSYSTEKIVYLDVEKIMQESIAGKEIIAKIKKNEQHQFLNLKKKKKKFLKKKKLISQKMSLVKANLKKKFKI